MMNMYELETILPAPVERSGRSDEFWKRLLDVVGAVAGLILLSPVFLIAAIAVKLDTPGPVIYRRRVMARGGGEFDAYKFRTMVVNGDEVLAAHPELLARWQREQKLENDPRVTRVGKWLRKFSIDELPQLVNVLRGEMSLVGPRMIAPVEMAHFGEYAQERLSVKPGLTGLWQIAGRADLPYEQRLIYDIRYVRTRNLWMDIKIIFLTIPAVLFGRGAY
jgi:lipopolysaccharide/colanic/teichoic acid biosynthesis glycosyltransferase